MPAFAVYFGLILARVGTFVAAFPLFAPRTPMMIRVGLSVALSVFFVSSVRPGWQPLPDGDVPELIYLLALLRESAIGIVIGFVMGLFLLPARIAGEFVTHQMGFAVSQQMGPTSTTPTGTIPQLFEAVAGVLFLGLDGHHVVLAVLGESFIKAPLGGSLVVPPPESLVRGLTAAHEMGLLVSGPLALSLFLLTIAMAMTARAAPQINIHSVGFTLQVIVALVGMLFLMPEIIQALAIVIERIGIAVHGFWG